MFVPRLFQLAAPITDRGNRKPLAMSIVDKIDFNSLGERENIAGDHQLDTLDSANLFCVF